MGGEPPQTSQKESQYRTLRSSRTNWGRVEDGRDASVRPSSPPARNRPRPASINPTGVGANSESYQLALVVEEAGGVGQLQQGVSSSPKLPFERKDTPPPFILGLMEQRL